MQDQLINVKTGFFRTCDAYKKFQASIIIFKELQEQAIYEELNKKDHVIKWFWEVLFELNEDEKKNFLKYVSGCYEKRYL